jgi:hypothetical protein
MSIASIYEWLNQLIIIAWGLLIILPRWKFTKILIRSGLYPAIFAVVYLVLALGYFRPAEVDFSALSGLMSGYQNPPLVVMGWSHYLVFDLFVGIWILADSEKHGIKHFWMIPILLLTLMVGPVGF